MNVSRGSDESGQDHTDERKTAAINNVGLSRLSEPVLLSGEWVRVTVNGWITAYFRSDDDSRAFVEKAKSESGREMLAAGMALYTGDAMSTRRRR